MTRAQTEPSDGFLDNEFASFREARLKARKTRRHEALEHRPRRAGEAQAPPSAPALAALIDGLEEAPRPAAPEAGPAVPEAPVAAEAPAPATRAPVADDAEAPAAIEGSCSDPEFEKFRAARRSGEPPRRPDSARMRRPEGVVEGSCSDPEFEKFRAARQEGRPDSARHRKPEAPAPEPVDVVEPAAAADAPAEDDQGGLFFGTSMHERKTVRARALDARADLPEAPPEAEAATPDGEPTPSRGERRRAPPPPLPERPAAS
ncbi:MAG: hypothetical protein KF878_29755 [Planctomycetes bacterium]|nr:hypothetical protein [Planctomycetota bacterium]